MGIVHSWAVTSRQVTWRVILSRWLWMRSLAWPDFWFLAYWSTLQLIPARNCIFREEEGPWTTFKATNQHFNALYMCSKRECLDILVLSCLLTTKGLILNIFWKFRDMTFIEVHKCLTKITETLSSKDVSEIDYLIFRKASIITLNHIINERKYIYQTHYPTIKLILLMTY